MQEMEKIIYEINSCILTSTIHGKEERVIREQDIVDIINNFFERNKVVENTTAHEPSEKDFATYRLARAVEIDRIFNNYRADFEKAKIFPEQFAMIFHFVDKELLR